MRPPTNNWRYRMRTSFLCGNRNFMFLEISVGMNGLSLNKRQRIQRAIKKDNPEKLTTQDTQDEDKHNKHTTHYVLDTTMHKQPHNTLCAGHHYAQTNTHHTMCRTPICTNKQNKQPEIKTTRTQLLCCNRNRHHNKELRKSRHIIGQHKKLKMLVQRHQVFVLLYDQIRHIRLLIGKKIDINKYERLSNFTL